MYGITIGYESGMRSIVNNSLILKSYSKLYNGNNNDGIRFVKVKVE